MAYAKDVNMETKVRSRKTDAKGTKVNNGKVPKSAKELADHNFQKEVQPYQNKIGGNKQTSPEPNGKTSCDVHVQRWLEFTVKIDCIALLLFLAGLATRMYSLGQPRNIVFDELHYGKQVKLYLQHSFFYDSHPPLGKLLVAGAAYSAGFNDSFKFDGIGTPYPDGIPIVAMRFVPALCGSLLLPIAYHIILELGLSQWSAIIASFLLLFDNALVTQSRFVLMEPMLLLFTMTGVLCLLKFRRYQEKPYTIQWWFWMVSSVAFLTFAACVKYVGFMALWLCASLIFRDLWTLLGDHKKTNKALLVEFLSRVSVLLTVPAIIYVSIFYLHLSVLTRTGPHDNVMTSAFQVSLEGGLAAITRRQPVKVAHGSQITLLHTHGQRCWLHSHDTTYPILYSSKRGSSHQQQVTCYPHKDVNNWWIIKRPEQNDLVVTETEDAIQHGDIIQLVHGLTRRALNSHDVAAPMSPQHQEVSCYVDYDVDMPPENLWKVDIINREQTGDDWHAILSQVRLIHVNSSQALRITGQLLPAWGFHQYEVVTDRMIVQDDTVWNVEEHRYTQSDDHKKREQELLNAEMIPSSSVRMGFWKKFLELQYKMIFAGPDGVVNHMYSSEPSEWPLLAHSVAYWVNPDTGAQVHLLGNPVVWWSGTAALFLYSALLTFYLLRQRRNFMDVEPESWRRFVVIGEVLLTGYFFHYVPFFFVSRTMFLHHYLPAFLFKVLLTAGLIDHCHDQIRDRLGKNASLAFATFTVTWLIGVFIVFCKFSVVDGEVTNCRGLSCSSYESTYKKASDSFAIGPNRFIRCASTFPSSREFYCRS